MTGFTTSTSSGHHQVRPIRPIGRVLAAMVLLVTGLASAAASTVFSAAPAAADPADRWTAVSAGAGLTCGLTADRQAWCWGQDHQGQLGNGSVLTSTMGAPSLVDGGTTRFREITAGRYHACAVDTDNTGWCWGAVGANGQGPSGDFSPSPGLIVGGHTWGTIGAGGSHTCGITMAQAMYCWGNDSSGQLGNGPGTVGTSGPGLVTVSGSPAPEWQMVSAGAQHTCATTKTQELYCWGQGTNGQLGNGATANKDLPTKVTAPATGWVAVSAGTDHTCGLLTSGQLRCWGRDHRGQLGNGATTTGDQPSPVAVPGTWTAIDAGQSTTCGRQGGIASCWGADTDGQLGNGPVAVDQHQPVVVDLPNLATAVSAGTNVSCFVTDVEDVRCTGDRSAGAVGDGVVGSVRVHLPVSVAQIRTDQTITFDPLPDREDRSGAFTLSATATSGLPVAFSGWGSCTVADVTVTIVGVGSCTVHADQAGDASHRPAPRVTRTFTVTPRIATGVWADVAVGATHTCGVTTAGGAWCWGSDTYGELGNGSEVTGEQRRPVEVADPADDPDPRWVDIAVGREHSCGLTEPGDLWCWGRDHLGQLGDGGALGGSSSVPVAVPRLNGSPWLQVAAGESTTCAVAASTKAACWGSDGAGKLGNGPITGNQTSPSLVLHPNGYPGFVAIEVGHSHACAVDTFGVTMCWGANDAGQLGLGGTTARDAPVALPDHPNGGDLDIRALEVGYDRSCVLAVIGSGSLAGPGVGRRCWGPALMGSLVGAGATDHTDVALGRDHACHVQGTSLWCLGDNGYGQHGRGEGSPNSGGTVGNPNQGTASYRLVTAGLLNTCGITTTGDLLCWGYNAQGQAGTGSQQPILWQPARVTLPVQSQLRVTTSPAVASQIIVDGERRDLWGLTWMDIEAGDHEVCFSEVVGLATPACRVVTVPEGGIGTTQGTFAPLVSLQVSTSPAVPGTISINGTPRDDWGVYTWAPAGQSLTVCFGPVAGYSPPPCQIRSAATVVAGTPIHLTGTYTPSPGLPGPTGTGSLRVATSPAVPATIFIDGQPRDDWGLDWLQLPAGTYEICYSDIVGFATPACQSATVTAGATTTVTGTFVQQGWINATTSPAREKTIEVDGIARNDWGAWLPVLPGPHQVCFRLPLSTAQPICRNVTVSAGQTTAVNDA